MVNSDKRARRFTGIIQLRWVLAAMCLAACASAPGPPPTAGDCMTMRLWSNGWHTSLALPAEVFSDEHPLRTLFPEARYFLIGWGERDFFMATDAGFWKGLKAIVPPSRSAIQVIAAADPVEDTLWRPSDLAQFAVSRFGAERMAEEIAARIMRDENGAPVILSEGRVPGASYFLAARGGFHLFNMCNHWSARRLREAGVRVNTGLAFTAGGLIAAARRNAPASCPID